jgi:hypothetical protein
MRHVEITCERYVTRGFFSVFAINPSSGQGDYTHSRHIIKPVPALAESANRHILHLVPRLRMGTRFALSMAQSELKERSSSDR